MYEFNVSSMCFSFVLIDKLLLKFKFCLLCYVLFVFVKYTNFFLSVISTSLSVSLTQIICLALQHTKQGRLPFSFPHANIFTLSHGMEGKCHNDVRLWCILKNIFQRCHLSGNYCSGLFVQRKRERCIFRFFSSSSGNVDIKVFFFLVCLIVCLFFFLFVHSCVILVE